MDATETISPENLMSGVTIVSRVAIPSDAVSAIVRDVAAVANAARTWGEDEDAIASLAFASGTDTALTIVRRESPDVASERPDLAVVLGAPAVDALRIDVLLKRSERGAFARADAALVMIAERLSKSFGALAVDDLGSIYDPAELARLSAGALPRALAFSYELAAASRVAADATLDIAPPVLPAETSACEAPRFANGAAFAAIGPHVPMLELARLVLALKGDARANPERAPVALCAPLVAGSEGLRLAALGVRLDLTSEAAPVRDAIDVVARDFSAASAIAVLESVAQEMISQRVGSSSAALPKLVTIGAAAQSDAERSFPRRLASFEFEDGSIVDVAYLDLADADGVFAAFVRPRHDLALLLGGNAGSVVSIELPVGSVACDVLGVRLASAFVAASSGVATDALGAVYGADELCDLAAGGRGRSGSWSERITRARASSAG